MMPIFYLSFSDSAKFAQAAANLLAGRSLVIGHSFFDVKLLAAYQSGNLFSTKIFPFTPWLLSLFFRFLPSSDQTIAIAGWLTFLLSTLVIFLIARKLHRSTSALIAAIIFFFSLPFWEYASNASSEIFFTLQVLLMVYLFLSRFRWLALLPLALMFFTRQQATIVFLSLGTTAVLLFLSSAKSLRFKLLTLAFIFIAVFELTNFLLPNAFLPLSPFQAIGAINLPANTSQGQFLRGQHVPGSISSLQLISKVFYNTYNYLKNLTPLTSPTIFSLFILGFFLPKSSTRLKNFNLFSLTIFGLFILAASATLPNVRYVHPIIPLVIIGASITLTHLVHRPLAIALVMFLILLPALGHLTLDARFRRQQFNLDKPPVYRQISTLMAENIPKGKLVITNLDAWAAWYEGLTTMWFPLSPDLLEGYQDKVSYIVITNYKEHDGDFALGEWREVAYSPDQIKNQFLKDNYRILKTFTISSDQVYENQAYQGTILVRRQPTSI